MRRASSSWRAVCLASTALASFTTASNLRSNSSVGIEPSSEISAGVALLVNHHDRQAAAGVPGGGPGVVLLAPAAHVLGDARVERAVGAPEQVDEPAVARRVQPRFAALLRHPDKILGA